MIVGIALGAFVVVVTILATLNSRRTRGRSCCAPADPADDLRMRGALDDQAPSAQGKPHD